MSEKLKTRQGSDGYHYPYTSTALVKDNNGKSVDQLFSEVESTKANKTDVIELDTRLTDFTTSETTQASIKASVTQYCVENGVENYDDTEIRKDMSTKTSILSINNVNYSIEKNCYYDYLDGVIRENANYTTFKYDVVGGDIFVLSTTVGLGGVLCLALFYDSNDNFVCSYKRNESSSKDVVYSQEVVNVPNNASYMRVTIRNDFVAPTVLKKEYIKDTVITKNAMLYLCTEDEISIKYTLDSEKSIIVTMGITESGNNLFDFKEISFVYENILTSDFTNKTIVTNGMSDYFGPYQSLLAINNIDGDMPNGYLYHFTGGYHTYTNGQNDTSKTARLNNVDILIDGNIPIKNMILPCNHINIKWCNYVQAANTKKENGSGREVLKEFYNVDAKNGDFVVNCNILALEDVSIGKYYGLQAFLEHGNRYLFVGGTNRLVQDITNKDWLNSGNKNCCIGIESNTNVAIKLEIDNRIDLSSMSLNTNEYSFFATGNKMYCMLISQTTNLNKDENMYFRGKYSFINPI